VTDAPSHYVALDSQNPAAHARRLVEDACDSWPTAHVQDAQLLITELVANAMTHSAASTVHVHIATRPRILRVYVADDSAAPPIIANPSLEDEHGRGLRIVDALAHSWGTAAGPYPRGKAVWFELRLEDGR